MGAGIEPHGTAESGAEAEVYMATFPALNEVTGKYFNVIKEARDNSQEYDENARKKLRELSFKLTGLN